MDCTDFSSKIIRVEGVLTRGPTDGTELIYRCGRKDEDSGPRILSGN